MNDDNSLHDYQQLLNEAVDILERIASVAGGFVSDSQRGQIEKLSEINRDYALARFEAALARTGWTYSGKNSWSKVG